MRGWFTMALLPFAGIAGAGYLLATTHSKTAAVILSLALGLFVTVGPLMAWGAWLNRPGAE